MGQLKKRLRKEDLISNRNGERDLVREAYNEALGISVGAAQLLGVGRSSLYRWAEAPELKDFFEEVKSESFELGLDKAEQALHHIINNGEERNRLTGLIFLLKTRGRQRGYIERQEVTQKSVELNAPMDGKTLKKMAQAFLDEDES